MLVSSREENIKRISIAWAPRYNQVRSQAKIPEGAKLFTMKSTRQGSNDGELLNLKYTESIAKRQRVQMHPLQPPGCGPVNISYA